MRHGPWPKKNKPSQCDEDTEQIRRPEQEQIDIVVQIQVAGHKPAAQHQDAIDTTEYT